MKAGIAVAVLSLSCAGINAGIENVEPWTATNIVLIVSDDLGWGDLRVYNPNSQVALPALELLASEGLTVTNAHSASSVCAPSRYSIASGNSVWRGRNVNGQWSPFKESQILEGQETLGDLLRRAGCRTGFFGKWHLGAQWYDAAGNITSDPEAIEWSAGFFDGPEAHGFDESLTALCGWQQSPYALFDEDGQWLGELPAEWMQPPGAAWSSLAQAYTPLPEGYGDGDWDQEAAADTALEAAVSFIAEHRDERFFLQYNSFQAHWSWTATGESGLSERVDQIIEFDRDVAVLLEALAAHGLEDETLVVVTSDNGGDRLPEELANGHDASAHLRGQKGLIYEGGHRVPLLVRWPAAIAAGSSLGETHLVGLQDLYATFGAAAGVGFGAEQGLDSFNQLCAWSQGENAPPARSSLIVQDNRGPNYAYYSRPWKLTLDADHEVWELFDLVADPSETVNQASSQGELTASLRQEFLSAYSAARTAPTNGALGSDRKCLRDLRDAVTIFADGFESGEVDAWSESTP